MNNIEIVSGTTPDETTGFLYRIHDGITQHDYVWLEVTKKEKLLKEINKGLNSYLSVEFPMKCGYAVPFWNNTDHLVVEFNTVSKEDQEYFTGPIREKRKK
jgi:hypothetical protein